LLSTNASHTRDGLDATSKPAAAPGGGLADTVAAPGDTFDEQLCDAFEQRNPMDRRNLPPQLARIQPLTLPPQGPALWRLLP
jgi:hypothetical protein